MDDMVFSTEAHPLFLTRKFDARNVKGSNDKCPISTFNIFRHEPKQNLFRQETFQMLNYIYSDATFSTVFDTFQLPQMSLKRQPEIAKFHKLPIYYEVSLDNNSDEFFMVFRNEILPHELVSIIVKVASNEMILQKVNGFNLIESDYLLQVNHKDRISSVIKDQIEIPILLLNHKKKALRGPLQSIYSSSSSYCNVYDNADLAAIITDQIDFEASEQDVPVFYSPQSITENITINETSSKSSALSIVDKVKLTTLYWMYGKKVEHFYTFQ